MQNTTSHQAIPLTFALLTCLFLFTSVPKSQALTTSNLGQKWNEEWSFSIGNTNSRVNFIENITNSEDFIVGGYITEASESINFIGRFRSNASTVWLNTYPELSLFDSALLNIKPSLDAQYIYGIFRIRNSSLDLYYFERLVIFDALTGNIVNQVNIDYNSVAQAAFMVQNPHNSSELWIYDTMNMTNSGSQYQARLMSLDLAQNTPYWTAEFNIKDLNMPINIFYSTQTGFLYLMQYVMDLGDPKIETIFWTVEPTPGGIRTPRNVYAEGETDYCVYDFCLYGNRIYMIGYNATSPIINKQNCYLRIIDLDNTEIFEMKMAIESNYQFFRRIFVKDFSHIILVSDIYYDLYAPYDFTQKSVIVEMQFNTDRTDLTPLGMYFIGENEQTTNSINSFCDSKGNIYVCGSSDSFLSGQTVGFVAKYAPILKEPTSPPIAPGSQPFDIVEFLKNQNWYMISGFTLFGFILGGIIFGLKRPKKPSVK